MKTKTINVSNLLLDTENARFPESVGGQREAIHFILDSQKDKIIKLATDIVEKGLDPSERMIVVRVDDLSYTVMEGNRRLTALKILKSPNIITNETLRKKIEKIADKATFPTEVDCVVYESNDEAYIHWIKLKHTGQNDGVGRVEWKAQEVDRFNANHGASSFGNQLLQFIEKESSVINYLKDNKKNLYITNINRLLDDPSVRKALGIIANNGFLYSTHQKNVFVKNISLILQAMLEVDDNNKQLFTVNRIRSKEDRSYFINNDLNINTTKDVVINRWLISDPLSYKEDSGSSSTGSGSTGSGSTGSGSTGSGSAGSGSAGSGSAGSGSAGSTNGPRDTNRNNLIPTSLNLKITDKKTKRIFGELKGNVNVSDAIYSTSVMLRVFLELSLSCYIEDNQIAFIKDKGKDKNGLHDKVCLVSNHLKTNLRLTGSQCTAVQTASSQLTNASGSFHQYVHNRNLHPDKKALNTEWDNFESLFKAIWA